MKTEYKIIVLSILLGLFLWVADAALDYFIYYQGTFWGLLIYEIPPHEIYARTLVLGCCVVFGVAIHTVFGKFRRAEEKRRESEKQLRLAVKNSRDVLYKLNLRTGDFDYVSPSVVELGGYTPQEFILLGVKGLLRRIDPEDRHRFMMHFRNVLRQAVEDGLAPTIEYRWKHQDGEYRWFSDNRAVVRDDDGNPVSLIGSVRDVTVQKEAEKALGESEKKYRTLIQTAQEGIGITSPEEEFVFVNRAFASILGYEPSELVGRNLREFVTGEQFEAFKTETGKRQWGTSGQYETEMRHQDGSHRSLLVSASPLYDREGNYNGTLGMVTDITERKRAEEALRETTDYLDKLIEYANAPIIVWNPGFKVTRFNRAFEHLTGYTAKEVIGQELSLLFPEGSRGESLRKIERTSGGEYWESVEIQIHRKDGGIRIALWNSANIYAEDGKTLVSTIAQGHDITERKKVEEALRESEEKHRTLLENLPQKIFYKDRDSIYVSCNQNYASDLEIKPEEIAGKTDYDFYPKDLADKYRADDRRLMESAETEEIEERYIQDGKEVIVQTVKTPVRDEEGNVVGILGIFWDITERKRAEEALRETTDYLDNLIEHANAPIIVWDPGFKITRFNRAFEHLTGYTAKEVIGQELSLLFPEGNRGESLRKIERTSSGEYWESVEIQILRKDGDTRVTLWNSANIYAEDGKTLLATIAQGHDITERKRAEEALRESEEKFRAVVENAANVILNVDREGTIQFINQTPPDKTVEEVIGTKIHDYILPEYHTVVRETIDRVFESGKPGRYEIRGAGVEGGTSWYDTQVGAIKQDGKVVAVTLITTDVTERKRTEEALWESEEKYRLVGENIPVVVYSALPDERSTTTLVSGRILELTGYSHEEFIEHAQLWTQIIHPDDREYVWKKIEEHREKMAPLDVEYRIITKDNIIKWIRDRATPMLDENGQIARIDGFMEDITERKRAGEAVKRSEEQLRALFDSAADLVFTKDLEGRYTRVNSACAKLHGLSEEEFVGKTDFDLFPEEQARHSTEIDRQVLVEGRTFTSEYDRQVGSKTFTFSVVKTPLYGQDNSVVGLCGIARDITDQRNLEAQFRQSQKMESLGTLAGGVAHDFNNLLGGVLGYVGLMKGDYSPGEKHYAMLELVEKAGVRAAELTNQLLAFSRKGKFELRAVNLNNSVEDVLKLIGRTLDKKIEIITELQEELPSVEGDPGQLEQAIINLCVNAAEATPGGGKLQLETRVVALEEEFARKYLGSDARDYVLLSVSDTGIGMDSETLSRMFEPFFTTKEMGKGTGLGLSTVYGIIKNHGGYVDVRSQPGKGSTFDIYLPVSKKEFTPPQTQAAELQTGHETILAVDDEEIIRSLLKETLEKLGYKVILANEGEEAIQIYDQKKDEIDAVIIDMIMPHVGGGETFREIKRRNPDVRVLLASGYSQDGAAQRILDEGVKGFIQKPFELVELSQKLRQVLD